MRATSFKRPVYARQPLPAPCPVRAVAPTVISAHAVSKPKTVPHRNRHLLDMARGKPCLLRVPGVCQGGTDTTVAAHSNSSCHGKAGARKADDHYSVWSCAACHIGWLDQGAAPRSQKAAAFMAAHLRQVLEWRSIAAAAGSPVADKKAALWALGLLNATPVYEHIEVTNV